jgi:hypothetical protein
MDSGVPYLGRPIRSRRGSPNAYGYCDWLSDVSEYVGIGSGADEVTSQVNNPNLVAQLPHVSPHAAEAGAGKEGRR